ncbi:MAG: hypothetical protein ACPGFB_05410 [Verrucomicrobiales bacterium]
MHVSEVSQGDATSTEVYLLQQQNDARLLSGLENELQSRSIHFEILPWEKTCASRHASGR